MSYFDFTGFEASIYHHIRYGLGKKIDEVSKFDVMNAVSFAVGKYLMDIRFETNERYRNKDAKRLYYLSMEFLIAGCYPIIY